jgi:CxxC motif-containing protein (DUF1111 family)
MVVTGSAARCNAQRDPGPRTGPANAGGPIKGLSPEDEKLFWASWEKFKRLYSVSGTLEKGVGLGPAFNGNSCAQCHAQPAAGGSSPSIHSPQVHQVVARNGYPELAREVNPQFTLASMDRFKGKEQTIPAFVKSDGPVLVPHFVRNSDGTPDGTTHDLYTIAGRTDAPGCVLPQPDFAREAARNNLAFRIPTATYGAGMVESIPDGELIANLESTRAQRSALGIKGRFNRSPNDGSISRFGWKAQNNSLLIFSAESYNVEMGVTSEAFPNKRVQASSCVFNALPEDRTRIQPAQGETYTPSAYASDIASFAAFMRLSAPPQAVTASPSEKRGEAVFARVGCVLCHTPTLRTGQSSYSGLSFVEIRPFSDFALHHMGPGIADGISQGIATSDEFRTAPLWGLGQRVFFLHDGRTRDLLEAIRQHDQRAGAQSTRGHALRSEAGAVVSNFNHSSKEEQQDLLNFLRSL